MTHPEGIFLSASFTPSLTPSFPLFPGLKMNLWSRLAWNLLSRPGWPWTGGEPPTPTPYPHQVLGLQVWPPHTWFALSLSKLAASSLKRACPLKLCSTLVVLIFIEFHGITADFWRSSIFPPKPVVSPLPMDQGNQMPSFVFVVCLLWRLLLNVVMVLLPLLSLLK